MPTPYEERLALTEHQREPTVLDLQAVLTAIETSRLPRVSLDPTQIARAQEAIDVPRNASIDQSTHITAHGEGLLTAYIALQSAETQLGTLNLPWSDYDRIEYPIEAALARIQDNFAELRHEYGPNFALDEFSTDHKAELIALHPELSPSATAASSEITHGGKETQMPNPNIFSEHLTDISPHLRDISAAIHDLEPNDLPSHINTLAYSLTQYANNFDDAKEYDSADSYNIKSHTNALAQLHIDLSALQTELTQSLQGSPALDDVTFKIDNARDLINNDFAHIETAYGADYSMDHAIATATYYGPNPNAREVNPLSLQLSPAQAIHELAETNQPFGSHSPSVPQLPHFPTDEAAAQKWADDTFDKITPTSRITQILRQTSGDLEQIAERSPERTGLSPAIDSDITQLINSTTAYLNRFTLQPEEDKAAALTAVQNTLQAATDQLYRLSPQTPEIVDIRDGLDSAGQYAAQLREQTITLQIAQAPSRQHAEISLEALASTLNPRTPDARGPLSVNPDRKEMYDVGNGELAAGITSLYAQIHADSQHLSDTSCHSNNPLSPQTVNSSWSIQDSATTRLTEFLNEPNEQTARALAQLETALHRAAEQIANIYPGQPREAQELANSLQFLGYETGQVRSQVLDLEAARTHVQSLSHTPELSISAALPTPADLTPQAGVNSPAQNLPEVSHGHSIDRGGYSM